VATAFGNVDGSISIAGEQGTSVSKGPAWRCQAEGQDIQRVLQEFIVSWRGRESRSRHMM
jgi:hypothetical protein